MILKIALKYKHRYLYIAIGVALLIISFKHYVYGIVLFGFGYYIYRKHSDLLTIIIMIFVLINIHRYYIDSQKIENSGQWEAKVVKVNDIDTFSDLYVQINHKKVRLYLSQGVPVKPGDNIEIIGSLKAVESATIPSGFNYQNYMKSKKLFGVIEGSNITKIGSSFHINRIPYSVEKYINQNIDTTKAYIKTFILADKSDFDPEVIKKVNVLGISHLFAVSGLHVGMLALFLTVLLQKMNMKEEMIENIVILVLLIYGILTGFTASITRASLMYIFVIFNNRYHMPFSTFDIISIIFLMLLIYHPYYFLDIGFVLSFTMTYILLLSQNYFRNQRTIEVMFKISIIAFGATLPIVANMSGQINLLTIVANVIFIPIITFIILPLSYITFLLPFFDRLFGYFLLFFEMLVNGFNNIDFFIFKVYFNQQLFVIVYYYLFFSWMYHFKEFNKSKIAIINILIFLILISNTQYLNPIDNISFLDVKGESTVIIEKFDRCNMVIDTGEVDDYDSLITYLDQHHLRRIDYLIISHFHSDHAGEMNDILDRYNVRNVVTSSNVAFFHNKKIHCGGISFLFYEMTYDSENENNNSLMFSLWFHQNHYLFTGDSETVREEAFIKLHDIDVDILKVGHHGSITSSSSSFIEHINPEVAYINIDRDNNHGHPNEIIIQRLIDNNIIIERTDYYGTIEVRYFLGKEYKKYYIP